MENPPVPPAAVSMPDTPAQQTGPRLISAFFILTTSLIRERSIIRTAKPVKRFLPDAANEQVMPDARQTS
jgi:hypothetical protein